jgi:hypothetical protein
MGIGPEERGFVIVPPVAILLFRGEEEDTDIPFSVFFFEDV